MGRGIRDPAHLHGARTGEKAECKRVLSIGNSLSGGKQARLPVLQCWDQGLFNQCINHLDFGVCSEPSLQVSR